MKVSMGPLGGINKVGPLGDINKVGALGSINKVGALGGINRVGPLGSINKVGWGAKLLPFVHFSCCYGLGPVWLFLSTTEHTAQLPKVIKALQVI